MHMIFVLTATKSCPERERAQQWELFLITVIIKRINVRSRNIRFLHAFDLVYILKVHLHLKYTQTNNRVNLVTTINIVVFVKRKFTSENLNGKNLMAKKPQIYLYRQYLKNEKEFLILIIRTNFCNSDLFAWRGVSRFNMLCWQKRLKKHGKNYKTKFSKKLIQYILQFCKTKFSTEK